MIKKEKIHKSSYCTNNTNILTPEQCLGINHIAFIADGNRRWAKKKKLQPIDGHKKGFFEIVPKVLPMLWANNIHTVTIWCFSTENWNRSQEETSYLMSIYDHMIDALIPTAQKHNGNICHLGRKDRIPKFLQKKIKHTENITRTNTTHTCNLAIDYSGHDEIACAIKTIVDQNIDINTLTHETISTLMFTHKQRYPNPDLIIRTGSAPRSSGFMLWQSRTSEYYFSDKMFPELDEQEIHKALMFFHTQKRKYAFV